MVSLKILWWVTHVGMNVIMVLLGYYWGKKLTKDKPVGTLNIYKDEDGQEYIFAEFFVGLDEIKTKSKAVMHVVDRK